MLWREDAKHNKDTTEGAEHTSKFRESVPCHSLSAPNPLCCGLRCDVGATHTFICKLPSCWALKRVRRRETESLGEREGSSSFLSTSWGRGSRLPYRWVAHARLRHWRSSSLVEGAISVYHLWSQLHHPPPQGLGLRPLGPFVKFPSFNYSNFFSHRDGSCAQHVLSLRCLRADGRLFCKGPDSEYFKLCTTSDLCWVSFP